MKTLFLLLAAAVSPLPAHVMSMSTGDVGVQGNRAHYELHMPIYEIADVKNPETALFNHIRFATAGQARRPTQKSCRGDMSQGSFICSADYEFPLAVDPLELECPLPNMTVPH